MDIGTAIIGAAVTGVAGLLAYFAKRDYERSDKRLSSLEEKHSEDRATIARIESDIRVGEAHRGNATDALGGVREDVARVETKVEQLADGHAQHGAILAAISGKIDVIIKRSSPPRGFPAVAPPQPNIPPSSPLPGAYRHPSRPDR